MNVSSFNSLIIALWQRLCRIIPERYYLKVLYRLKMNRRLNLESPRTMNEKLQWLKLNYRNPKFTTLVDKVQVKKYISNMLGSEFIIPTLGVWDHFDDIPFDALPNQFVLKTNHSGGNTGVIVCGDKSKLDLKAAKKKLEKSLRCDISFTLGEWPYRNVSRKILAEVYMGEDLVDYKFYCFNGYADVVLLCIDRCAGHPKFYFFDREWNLRRLNKMGKEAPADFTLPKPKGMDAMFQVASKLSEGIPFVRVDLYYIDDKIYFGEMTFFPASGFDKNRLPEADMYFGSKIVLPEI